MSSSSTSCGILAAVLSLHVLPAQADAPAPAAAREQLQAAVQKTRSLDGLAFKSVESQDDAMLRNLPLPARDAVQVSGVLAGGMLHASIGYDDDEVVIAGTRMIARAQNGAWKLRRGCLAGGQPLPFVLDPSVLLGGLADLPPAALQTVHVETGRLKDKDVVIYGVTLTGDLAHELMLSGSVPRAAAGRMMVMIGGPVEAPPRPELTLDVAVTVDPSTGYVVRVHSKAYAKSELPPNVQVRIAGADGEEIASTEEAEAEEPAAKDAPLQYSKGLPQRSLGSKTSLTDFDVTLAQHGQAKPPAVNDAAKALLGAGK